MLISQLFESSPRTLYHGTLKEYLPHIKSHGLQPTVGDFVSNFYDPSDDEGYDPEQDSLEPLVFAASKYDLIKCINAIIFRLKGKGLRGTPDEIIKYGAILVIKDVNNNFIHRPIEDFGNWYDEHPRAVEPNDFYSDHITEPFIIYQDSKLKNLLRRNGFDAWMGKLHPRLQDK